MKIVLIWLAFVSEIAQANVVALSGDKIKNIRVEGSRGFVGFDSSLPKPQGCSSRTWIDLNDEVGRVKYSTAMMAFASDKRVTVRVDTAKQVIYGACQFYDIVVVN